MVREDGLPYHRDPLHALRSRSSRPRSNRMGMMLEAKGDDVSVESMLPDEHCYNNIGVEDYCCVAPLILAHAFLAILSAIFKPSSIFGLDYIETILTGVGFQRLSPAPQQFSWVKLVGYASVCIRLTTIILIDCFISSGTRGGMLGISSQIIHGC